MEPQNNGARFQMSKVKTRAIGIISVGLIIVVLITIYIASGSGNIQDKKLVSFGGSCQQGHESDCTTNLLCTGDYQGQSTCQCPFGEDQIYIPEIQKCFGKVGSSCPDAFESSGCVSGAVCIKIKYDSWCECISGYVENAERGCDAGYEKSCNSSVPCRQTQGLICDYGVCDCKKGYNYDLAKKKCSTPLGQSCTRDDECFTNAFCNGTEVTGIPGAWGRCACKENMTRSIWDGACSY